MADQWERVQTVDGFHVRFRADNNEPVVHGENLKDKESCDTAILSVARAHSPVHRATIETRFGGPRDGLTGTTFEVVRVWNAYDTDAYQSGSAAGEVLVVDMDERTLRARVAARVRRRR